MPKLEALAAEDSLRGHGEGHAEGAGLGARGLGLQRCRPWAFMALSRLKGDENVVNLV